MNDRDIEPLLAAMERRLADVPNGFVVNDDVEIGFGNKVQLWLFVFLH